MSSVSRECQQVTPCFGHEADFCTRHLMRLQSAKEGLLATIRELSRASPIEMPSAATGTVEMPVSSF